jgi:hypothetical protein
MRFARLTLLAAVALFVATAHASSAANVPSGLHGFLLRADEVPTTTFHRTPSFAWTPVPGALRYEFQLSTSSLVRDTGVLYRNNSLLTPVAAPPLTLPWITGSPHALYARVRAVLASGETTDWSAPFGFDVTPPPPPTPLPSYPGVLRWTPVEGTDGYEVWLIDAKKFENVTGNVLDEREFYSFHQAPSWTGTIRWRIRAVRDDAFTDRINGIPAARTGAWSPVYSTTNPAMSTGKITLLGTVSDILSDGSASSDAHRTMPAFLWSGNQTDTGQPVELYRVYVYTDKQCLNRVYTSAVVGSPAYAPRPYGPLNLPSSALGITAARSRYLDDGTQSNQIGYDGEVLDPQTSESVAPATPTTQMPASDVPAAPGTTAPTDGTGAAATGAGSSGLSVAGNFGAPVDLWDADWPQSGYYWTVVPVQAFVLGAASSTVSSPGASKGSTVVPVADASSFAVGSTVTVGFAPSSDTATVIAVGGGTITLSSALGFGHGVGETVIAIASSVVYRDLELPQDVCASGRIQRFGISSEPSLTTAQSPFATGLSATGRLTSAAGTPSFYGQPLVAWTSALGAEVYQVQWSKKSYPFVPEVDPRSSSKGLMTFSNSAILPLTPGTWYYRVRGFDYNLPTGVQQMSWSDPEKIVVTKPKFKVAPVAKKKFKVVGG